MHWGLSRWLNSFQMSAREKFGETNPRKVEKPPSRSLHIPWENSRSVSTLKTHIQLYPSRSFTIGKIWSKTVDIFDDTNMNDPSRSSSISYFYSTKPRFEPPPVIHISSRPKITFISTFSATVSDFLLILYIISLETNFPPKLLSFGWWTKR